MIRLFLVVSLFILQGITAKAQSGQVSSFGKGILNIVSPDSSWAMKIGARFQFLSNQEWGINPSGGLQNPTSDFIIRRSRLKVDGFAYSPKLEYKLEFGLSNLDMSGISAFTSNTPRYIMDAVVKWNFYKNFVLWVGQTKLPGNVERVISSGNLQMVDRSLLNSRFNIDRDIGMQMRHQNTIGQQFVIREIFALSQGEGRNITTGNLGGHQYTSRLEILPLGSFNKEGDYSGGDLLREPLPKLMLAASYDYNHNAVRTRSNQGSYMITSQGFFETPITTIFIDAVFKHKGFSFMGEFASRTAENPIAIDQNGEETGAVVEVGKGLNLQSGYLLKSNWELAARYTNIKPDPVITGLGFQEQYTIGLSKYVVGHKLKVQSDISYLVNAFDNNEVMWRLQMDLHF